MFVAVDRQDRRPGRDRRVARLGVDDVADHQVHRRRSDEPGDEDVRRQTVQLIGRGDLLQHAGRHQRHPVAHRHRLDLVVGDVEHRRAEAALQLGDLAAHHHAQLGIEVRQRFVHQEHLGLAHHRPAHRHPLALPARELARSAIEQFLELQLVGHLQHPFVALGLGHLRDAQRVGEVLADGEMRVQRVALEHHRDVAVLGTEVVDLAVADRDRALGDVLEPGEHAQRRGLAATRRADDDEQLTVGDVEIEVIDGHDVAVEALRDGSETDGTHRVASGRSESVVGSDSGVSTSLRRWRRSRTSRRCASVVVPGSRSRLRRCRSGSCSPIPTRSCRTATTAR